MRQKIFDFLLVIVIISAIFSFARLITVDIEQLQKLQEVSNWHLTVGWVYLIFWIIEFTMLFIGCSLLLGVVQCFKILIKLFKK